VPLARLVAVLEGEVHCHGRRAEAVQRALDEEDVARREEVVGQQPELQRPAVGRHQLARVAGGRRDQAAPQKHVECLLVVLPV